MGVTDASNGDTLHNLAKLPVSREKFAREANENMRLRFPKCKPLPGGEWLLSNLSHVCSAPSGAKIELALAFSTKSEAYELKVLRSETVRFLSLFPTDRRILGDDTCTPYGRGKLAPNICLAALDALFATFMSDEGAVIKPSECLIFENGVVGDRKRVRERVAWVPHPHVAFEHEARQKHILAARSGMFEVGDDWQLKEMDDVCADSISSLEHFDWEVYGTTGYPVACSREGF